jgi:hypothetical protein
MACLPLPSLRICDWMLVWVRVCEVDAKVTHVRGRELSDDGHVGLPCRLPDRSLARARSGGVGRSGGDGRSGGLNMLAGLNRETRSEKGGGLVRSDGRVKFCGNDGFGELRS